ncbi:hypothetical protein LRAMOSA07554 [Lichtheimia ramosa]|uniref:ER membrane protein complex subunit 7 beta-sandwich domain-containing protein n=1 Tax=Lichtheimia ramosa TaxID=688394 RepID=A0A077WC95_9FUNG|nr:hypothetical protein LRAMOSA07554 [Lichtheimia ramosa]
MTHPIVLLLFVAVCLTTLCQAALVSGSIATNAILTDLNQLRPSTRVLLDGGKYTSHITTNGRFEFSNIEPGSYLLEVQSVDYIFPKLRLEVDHDKGLTRAAYSIYGQSWDKTGYTVEQPLELRAKAVANYFMQRQGFNVFGLFKNPMFLMLGVSGLMLLVMPKMMQNLDPEALKEISQTQADAQKMMSDMPSLAKMLGGQQPANPSRQQQQRR